MKYVFDYEETLCRRVTVHANDLGEAIAVIQKRIEDEKIVLGAEDFAGGKISMPMDENFLPQIERYGEEMTDKEGLDLVIDYW